MILVLVIGGGLGWILYRARVQYDAVAAIRKAGGQVSYDRIWTSVGTTPPKPMAFKWPKWLEDVVGVDYLYDVAEVRLLDDQRVSPDELMVEVGRLDRLGSLSLNGCMRATDIGLAHIRNCTRLRELDLSCSGVKGPGLANLSGMTDLRLLHLGGLPVTDADLGHLSELSRLEILRIDGEAVTDTGLAHLRDLDLRSLSLSGSSISTVGLAHLRGMTHLEFLAISGSSVTSLEPLRGLGHLKGLVLLMTPSITDEGCLRWRPSHASRNSSFKGRPSPTRGSFT
jgi:hypothetical protein